jgi:hypothetical protein
VDDQFAPLTAEELRAAEADTAQASDVDEWTPITPIPANAYPVKGVHLFGRAPDQSWTFRNAEEQPLGIEYRWLVAGGEKETRFVTYCRHPSGHQAWQIKHLPTPRPLYNLDKLAERPDAPVLITEGAKKCEPAERLFPEYAATAWIGGANGVDKTDWSPLKGRRVVIWGDNDEPGRKAAARVAELALAAGAASVSIVPVPSSFPPKWDLADEPPAGADLAALLASARPRPEIQLRPGEIPRIVDEIEKALIDAGATIYSRAGNLVRPVTESVPAAKGRMTTVARFRPMCENSLADHAARVAQFRRLDQRSAKWVVANPPAAAMKALLAREGEWRFPQAVGIITTPILRPDGTVLSAPGYDPTTRLYLAPDPSFVLPPVPEALSKEQAQAALALLEELLDKFPFVTPVDRAVALSGILTAVIRGAISVAPMHAIRAHTPGTGKSYLVDLIAAIATGRRCPVIAAGKSEQETETRLGALLRDGVPIISLDNVNAELGGDMLCQLTERPIVRVRILGKSEAPEFECRSTVLATGNNLTLVGDMVRRVLPCNIDPGVERPELRVFDFDPIESVLADRGKYVAAVMTIIKAYRAAGSPQVCGPIGSYEEWSSMVRSPLIWLGHADPVESMEAAREEDPELQAIREMHAHWREHLIIGSKYTSAAIVEFACQRNSSGDFKHPEFNDLLLRIASEGGRVSTRALGKWLSRNAGRNVDGFVIHVKNDNGRGNKFSLVAREDKSRGNQSAPGLALRPEAPNAQPQDRTPRF